MGDDWSGHKTDQRGFCHKRPIRKENLAKKKGSNFATLSCLSETDSLKLRTSEVVRRLGCTLVEAAVVYQ